MPKKITLFCNTPLPAAGSLLGNRSDVDLPLLLMVPNTTASPRTTWPCRLASTAGIRA